MKNTFRYILPLLFLGLSSAVWSFPQNSLRPGGLAVISISPSASPRPTVYYHKNKVALVHGKTNWLAIVGIPLNAKTGRHTLSVRSGKGKKYSRSFQVKPHHYRTQRLTISNKNKVNPGKKSRQRIARESALKRRLRNTFTATPPQLNFITPAKGRRSSSFGLKRILNRQKKNPHSGMDIAAPRGRAIKAAAKGKVIYKGNLFYTGNVVYLDHGNGVISLYAHMSKIDVKKGQTVKRGQIIGKVGSTGRVTGPHLHWSVYLNGTVVDPAIFIK